MSISGRDVGGASASDISWGGVVYLATTILLMKAETDRLHVERERMTVLIGCVKTKMEGDRDRRTGVGV